MANKECPLCGADLACLRWSGVQALWGRPCLVLEPVRAFAFGQGVRAPTLGGVRLGDRLPERVAGSGIPPQHIELLLHVLIAVEKHKMLPVFPRQPCIWIEQGEFSCSINRC